MAHDAHHVDVAANAPLAVPSSSSSRFSAALHSRAPFSVLQSARLESVELVGAHAAGSITHSLIPRRKTNPDVRSLGS
jgi:hypothetical protein